MNSSKRLNDYKDNVTSQFGEDGILRELFQRLGVTHRIAVEFGAWDGYLSSNTWDLWHNHGWKAYLFEANDGKFETLRRNSAGYPGVVAEKRFIRIQGPDSLDEVLMQHALPRDFDLLSIDIDGDDFYIFKNLTRFRPRVVVIEYNQTIPNGIDLVQMEGGCMGASPSSLVVLARSLDYALIAATDSNLIFVDRALLQPGLVPEEKLADVLPSAHLTYLLTDFQGNAYISGWPANDIKPKELNAFNALKTALRNRKGRWRRVLTTCKLIPVKVFKSRF
jgi:hypothetical protein